VLSILALTPPEKAFHFYAGIGKPLNRHAHDLLEFCDQISKINAESIEFHMNRGDFQAWFKVLGDAELAKKMELLKAKLSGEELRKRILELAESRCMALSKMAGQAGAPP
jgi:hypothetical protein